MAVVTFFSIALAVYLGFFFERRPSLVATVNSMSPVFDVVKPVGGLDISYAGVNLREAKKSLWSVDLTLRNEGNSDIRLDDFDPHSPVRIVVNSGQVVNKPTLTTSNRYLADNVRLITENSDVAITPAIIDADDSININILVMGAEGVRPVIYVTGKIAGMKAIPLRTVDSSTDGKSVWRKVFGADAIWIQFLRLPVYFFGFFALLGILAVLGFAITAPFDRIKERRKREVRAEEIKKIRLANTLDQKANALAEEYIENGDSSIAAIAHETSIAYAKSCVYDAMSNSGVADLTDKTRLSVGPILQKWALDRFSKLGLVGLKDGEPVGISELNQALDTFCALIGRDRTDLQTKHGREVQYPPFANFDSTTP
ncbi:hypothetical protein [Pararobbsia alpina]|nr:hypothetical protein [Pararobbsia alpina]